MITTSTELTLSLAKAFGVYMIASGLSGLLAGGRWTAILENFREKAGLTYVTGVFVFALGVAIIMAHNIWTDPLAVIVSFMGWAAAIKGLVITAYPDPLFKSTSAIMRPGVVLGAAIFTIVFGALLLAAGFIGVAR